jgi:hypothetical protein
MESFGLLNNEFINLYSKDNPILETDDQCFFLISNAIDYHRPLICQGIIMDDKFTDGMNKAYWIKYLNILEVPTIISEFFFGKSFFMNVFNEGIVGNRRLVQIGSGFNFTNNLFKIESFFIRKSEEEIIKLRDEYILVIKKDLLKMIKDIENI